jgi:hypothetical protein
VGRKISNGTYVNNILLRLEVTHHVGCAALWLLLQEVHGMPTVSREDTDVNKKKIIYHFHPQANVAAELAVCGACQQHPPEAGGDA